MRLCLQESRATSQWGQLGAVLGAQGAFFPPAHSQCGGAGKRRPRTAEEGEAAAHLGPPVCHPPMETAQAVRGCAVRAPRWPWGSCHEAQSHGCGRTEPAPALTPGAGSAREQGASGSGQGGTCSGQESCLGGCLEGLKPARPSDQKCPWPVTWARGCPECQLDRPAPRCLCRPSPPAALSPPRSDSAPLWSPPGPAAV